MNHHPATNHATRERQAVVYGAILEHLGDGDISTGKQLAAAVGVSLRQLYRHMAALRRRRLVRGQAGVGYMARRTA